jgi:serine/threonine protein kinase
MSTPQHQEDSLVGTTINSLNLTKVLGSGSFATVYLANHTTTGSRYAVKVLSKAQLSPDSLRLQLLESEILSSLSHPNIIALHETIETDSHVYLVLEYCRSDLFDAIMATKGYNEPTARHLFSQLCQAVASAHKCSVFHRDLKPENILLLDAHTVKLADFGLATTDALSSEFGCGSVRYMAPECLAPVDKSMGLAYSTSANDVWSLGIILINMLTGKNPWVEPCKSDRHYVTHMKPDSARSFKPRFSNRKNASRSLGNVDEDSFATQFGFSKELCALLRRIFSLDPFARPSAAELVIALEKIPHLFAAPHIPAVTVKSPVKPTEEKAVDELMFSMDFNVSSETLSPMTGPATPPGSWSAFADRVFKEGRFKDEGRFKEGRDKKGRDVVLPPSPPRVA